MQNYIIKLKGLSGRQDDPDVAFETFIGPGSLSDLVGWLRKNGFIEGPLWIKSGKSTLFCDPNFSRKNAHKVHAIIIPLNNINKTKNNPCIDKYCPAKIMDLIIYKSKRALFYFKSKISNLKDEFQK